ncbi:hypothetical protein HK099_003029 [Clydaea vesicula]|uniref:Succinate-semialdehyde dehydrogenase, mitochondrial n=1 Tax=Clydaea vesicula TaxID=447962 RepID=A0AAD5U2E3_9FUNG|nr:hypothetical protein HK099_003029 [Clydaea vesicula]
MSLFNVSKLNNKALFTSKFFINGKWNYPTVNGQHSTFETIDPSSNTTLGTVADCTKNETSLAISAASDALENWKNTTNLERSNYLKKLYDLILKNESDLALICSAESGKSLKESLGEIRYGASYVRWFSEEATRINGETLAKNLNGKRMMTIRQPIGVAFAAGCTVVLKPASETPHSALALAILAEEAGFPEGVFNVVTCSKSNASGVGEEMCKNKTVRKISFTGSTAVGKILMSQCSDSLKRLSLELGGNAPFIVFEDADIKTAVKECIAAKFRNSGQTCVAANRIFVSSAIKEKFNEELVNQVSKLKVGAGLDPSEPQIGSLINEAGLKKVQDQVNDAKTKGGKLLLGGNKIGSVGNFFEPTILVDLNNSMDIMNNETFGPVVAIQTFESEKEVLTLANGTSSGLAGYFFSENISRIYRVAEKLEVGMVGVNTGLISSEFAPFGGIKESGYGREGSSHGIEDYTNLKYICLGIQENELKQ